MARRIEETWPDDPDGWLGLLSHARRDKVEKEIKNAKQNDTFVSHIVLTQFADKATIIRKQGLVPGSQSSLNKDLRSIRSCATPLRTPTTTEKPQRRRTGSVERSRQSCARAPTLW